MNAYSRNINVSFLSAKEYDSPEAYWNAHLEYIDTLIQHAPNTVVVMEDYLLYADKVKSQTHSRMETPKLIGIIQHHCFVNKIPCFIEPASAVKTRWTNPILERAGYIKAVGNSYQTQSGQKIMKHQLDAIRHAAHFASFINGKKECLYGE